MTACSRNQCPNKASSGKLYCEYHLCPSCFKEKSSNDSCCDVCKARTPPLDSGVPGVPLSRLAGQAKLPAAGSGLPLAGRLSPARRQSPARASPARAPPRKAAVGFSEPQAAPAASPSRSGGLYLPRRQAERERLTRALESGEITQAQYDRMLVNIQRDFDALWHRERPQPVSLAQVADPQLNTWLSGRQYEKVVKYTYHFATGAWQKSCILIHMPRAHPIGAGSLRETYRYYDLSQTEGKREWVAKKSKKDNEPLSVYLADAAMQALCQYLADEYNKLSPPPPKKVEFVEAGLIECVERPGRDVYAIEPYLGGKYEKHSNNWGWCLPEGRNTPQAFSHFTYAFSEGQAMVVDVQGVGDRYTDPQVHSVTQRGYGKGDQGIAGIKKFFQSHRCNPICVHLGLADATSVAKFSGTVPRAGASSANSSGVVTSLNFNADGTPVMAQWRRLAANGPPPSNLSDINVHPHEYEQYRVIFLRYSNGSETISLDDLIQLLQETQYPVPMRALECAQRGKLQRVVSFGELLAFVYGFIESR